MEFNVIKPEHIIVKEINKRKSILDEVDGKKEQLAVLKTSRIT